MSDIKNVLICGIGAIGSIYANKINNSPADLRVLVDKKRFENYQKNPKVFNGVPLELTYVLPDDNDFRADLVIIATKFDGLSFAIENIKNFIKKDTVILSLLNGVNSEALIAEKYGGEHVLISYFIGHSAMRSGNNITFDGTGKIVFGSDKGNFRDVERVKKFFDCSDIDYDIPDDILRSYWLKYMLNVSGNQLSAVMGLTFGQMQDNPYCMKIIKNIMDEVVEIAKRAGVKNTDTMTEDAIRIFNTMSKDGKTSMLQDIEAGRKTEVEIFADAMIEFGKKYNVPTPYNCILKDMISAAEFG